MAIRTYIEDGKKLHEVYVHGHDAKGMRIQRKRRGIETLRKAEVAEFELKRELAKLREEAIPYRWSEWFSECIRRMKLMRSPSTVINFETRMGKWINHRWQNLELKQITKMCVYKVIFEEIGPEMSAQNRRTILKMVSRIFQMAVEEGAVDRNPCAGLQIKVPETEQKVLTNAEAEIFLREAKRADHRFFPHWFLALKSGMRSGELMALCWTDIDFEGRMISVSKQWNSKVGFAPTKTQRTRAVPISEDLVTYLKELKLRNNSEFVLPRLQEWENGMQAQVTRDFCMAVGITPVKFHDLRATFITNLLSRGVPLAQVMAVVGHSQLKTTNGYLRKAGVEVRGVTDQLGYKMPEISSGAKVISLQRD